MRVTLKSYRKDKYYPSVVRAVARLLAESDEISPVAVLLEMGNLLPKHHDAWRRGRVPYLERVFQGNLSKANRILRIIGFHAKDLNMAARQRTYRQYGKKRLLRFSKSGDPNIEAAYSRHYRWNQCPEWKLQAVEQGLAMKRKKRRRPRSAPPPPAEEEALDQDALPPGAIPR